MSIISQKYTRLLLQLMILILDYQQYISNMVLYSIYLTQILYIMYKYPINTLKRIAVDLSNSINPPYTVLLQGNLGTGKTTFSRFFLQSILINSQVITSPTFNIINVYNTTKGEVWHVDLYW